MTGGPKDRRKDGWNDGRMSEWRGGRTDGRTQFKNEIHIAPFSVILESDCGSAWKCVEELGWGGFTPLVAMRKRKKKKKEIVARREPKLGVKVVLKE